MEQIINYLAATYPVIMEVCSWVGVFFIVLAIFRPVLDWIVKKTPSEKDDKVVAKLYYFYDYLSPDFVRAFTTIARSNKKRVVDGVEKAGKVAGAVKDVLDDDNDEGKSKTKAKGKQ